MTMQLFFVNDHRLRGTPLFLHGHPNASLQSPAAVRMNVWAWYQSSTRHGSPG